MTEQSIIAQNISIRLAPDGFYFSDTSGRITFVSEKKFLNADEPHYTALFKNKFDKELHLNIYIYSECFSVVPNEIYSHERSKDILSLEHESLPSNHVVLSDKFKDLGFTVIYTVPLNLYNSLKSLYRNIKFHFLSEAFNKTNQHTELNIWVGEEKSVFRVLKENSLVLFNDLAAKTEEDLLFYILKIAEDFQLDLETVQIFQPGKLLREETFTAYLQNCSFPAQEEIL